MRLRIHFRSLILCTSFLFGFFGCAASEITTPPLDVPNHQTETAKKFVASARAQIGIVTTYDGSYVPADKIPANGGVCSDVIWRALASVNISLQQQIEKDIKKYPTDYPTTPAQDPDINFRRVRNIQIYLERHAKKLTTKIIPGDPALPAAQQKAAIANLQEWQGGDIVTFAELPTNHLLHIAIVSDKRRADGTPLIIHNYGQGTKENDYLQKWPTPITGHYRLF